MNKKELRILVAYFSIPETDNPNNMTQDEENSAHVVGGKVLGNTQYVGLLIQEALKADIYRIETTIDYPFNHSTLVNQAKVELKKDVRPELKNPLNNMSDYEIVFIGYPNWWADFPMPVYTFLETYDLSNKRVIPFVTHGGSGPSRTVQAIIKKQPNAIVEKDVLVVNRDYMDEAPSMVKSWLSRLNV